MTYDYQTGQPSTDGSRADAAREAARDTAHTAQDQASGVAHSAAESGRHLAHEAGEQARDVTREAGRQAEDLLRQGRDELAQQASDQQHKLAGGLRSFSQELDSMADSSEEHGLASDLAHQVAGRVGSAAQWLDDREPGALLDEVKRFARNRPGTFLAIAAGAGLLAGRLTRGLKDVHDDETGSAGQGRAEVPSPRAGGAPLGAPTRTSAYGAGAAPTTSTYGTGAVYGTQTDSGLGTAAGAPVEGVQATPGETGAYPEGAVASDPYGTGTQDVDQTVAYGDPVQDTYGAGTQNPPSGAGQFSAGTYGYQSSSSEDAGVFGGGTSEVPEREAEQANPWSPVHGEEDQR